MAAFKERRVEAHAGWGLGGANPFTGSGITAIDKLLDDLSTLWDCSTWRHTDGEKLANGIIARQRRYRDDPVIAIIGHSAFCQTMVETVAPALQKAGITVDYLAPIDPTALLWFGIPWFRMGPPMVVPANVKMVREFWATSGPPAAARKADKTGNSGGRYIYAAGRFPPPIIVPGGHSACASAQITRTRILDDVKELLT